MRKLTTAVIGVLGLTIGTTAWADNTATQTVTFEVTAINEITVTGDPSLTINSATAGSGLNMATDALTSWAITTNAGTNGKKLTASINNNMPDGLTLQADFTAPTGAVSEGAKTLSSSAVNVVTGIEGVAASGLGITYTLSATVGAGVVNSSTRTVTLTLTDT